jgi:hypothetical protein
MPAVASLTPALQSLQASFFVPIQPAVHGIGITAFQESALGDRMGRLALGDLENRRTPLANIRPQIMVSTAFQFLLLYSGQLHRSSLQNRLTSHVTTTFWIKPIHLLSLTTKPLPNLFVKTH